MSLRNSLNHHPEMKQDFFKILPSAIVIDILSGLPVRTIITCKCVQKSWLQLVENKEFVKVHLSKSSPGLIICQFPPRDPNLHNFFEFQDRFGVEHHGLFYKLVTKFNLTNAGWIMGSADGLLFQCKVTTSGTERETLCICNPITRDYINIDCPEVYDYSRKAVKYGFGSSKITKQYKVVRIFRDCKFNGETQEWQISPEAECCVYTLATRSWRSYASRALLQYRCIGTAASANGNLHWLARDVGISPFFLRIFCFDLEIEQYITFSIPPFPWNGKVKNLFSLNLFAWGDCLGLCDNTSGYEIAIWVMKEYGDEKSWIKELVLSNDLKLDGYLYPIKVFKNGDVLIHSLDSFLFYYSSKTKSMLKLPSEVRMQAILHTPSFLSLKSLGLDVSSF